MLLKSAKTASAAIPTTRNGSDNSHTTGHRINTAAASGQHTINKSVHNSITSNTFIYGPFKCVCLLSVPSSFLTLDYNDI